MNAALESESRTYFESFEAALTDFDPPAKNLEPIRAAVASVKFSRAYIPSSRSHIGLEAEDGGPDLAFVGAGFVALHPRGGKSAWVDLPIAPTRAGGYTQSRRVEFDRPVAACGTCFTKLPATGVCDYCG